jgi:hypothetical protein
VTATGSVLILALLQGVTGPALSPESSPTPSSTVIAVIVPSATDVAMMEALTRLRGEAASVGLEIRLVESPVGVGAAEPMGQIDRVARALMPAAVVALVGTTDVKQPAGMAVGPSIGAIDVWFLDRATGKTSVGHLSVDAEAGSRAELVLAVRVVDFIRARMFDSLVRTQLDKDKRRPVATHTTVGRRHLGLGLIGTGSFSGFSPAFLPFLWAGYSVRPWLRLALGVGGWGRQPRPVTLATAGSATLDEALGVASVSLFWPPWWRFVPCVQTGVSLLHLVVHGEADSGYLGHDATGWSPGWFASAGIEVVLSRHIVLQLSGGAMLLLRAPKVFIADQQVARTGWPAWLGNALLGVTF